MDSIPGDSPHNSEILVTAPKGLPTGPNGRIALAAPALTGDPLKDTLYEGWLYALVATASTDGNSTDGGSLQGLYITKDYGNNWTQIQLPFNTGVGEITNDNTKPSYNPLGVSGNETMSLVVDPNNPNIVYLGGDIGNNGNSQFSTLLRVDNTRLNDVYSTVAYNNHANDGGLTQYGTTGGVTLLPYSKVDSPQEGPGNPYGLDTAGVLNLPQFGGPAPRGPFYSLERDPSNPFLTPSTLGFDNIQVFNNTGYGTTYQAFDLTGIIGDSQGLFTSVAIKDPTTGQSRLIFGDLQGIWTGVDTGDGTLSTGTGSALAVTGSRNGNLQLEQMTDGAAQPSTLAAQIAGALFYASTIFNGSPISSPNILSTGNLVWNEAGTVFSGGIASTSFHIADTNSSGVAVDKTGTGQSYQNTTPDTVTVISPFTFTDFFLVTLGGSTSPTGRTTGLLQAGDDPKNGTGQWPPNLFFPSQTQDPSLLFGRFAVNPIDPSAILISSIQGRLFETSGPTTGTGIQWFPVANPGDLDGSYAYAVAFGAPQTGSPSQDNFMYAGTLNGNVFATLTGGGVGTPWKKLGSPDGSPVMSIAPNPTPGSHDVYAVTLKGVYYMADSSIANPVWTTISGNLFSPTLAREILNVPGQTQNTLKFLTSIVPDWRYAIPNNATDPATVTLTGSGTATFSYLGVAATSTLPFDVNTTASALQANLSTIPALNGIIQVTGNPGGPFVLTAQNGSYNPLSLTVSAGGLVAVTPGPAHPVLYVAGSGGVFRSLNNGTNWTYYPDMANDNAAQDGGLLPGSVVTQLSLAQGNINPATGTANQANGFNVLLASTYGSGDFAIRLDPNVLVAPNAPLSTFNVNPAQGPHVVALTSAGPSAPGLTNVAGLIVTFSSAVDPQTMTLAKIAGVTAPDGTKITLANVVDITPPGANNLHNIYEIVFATPQSAPGFYSVTLGPNISDSAGNEMDQNQNGIDGESTADVYAGRILFQPFANNAPVLNGTATTLTSIVQDTTAATDPGTSVNSIVAGLTPAPGITDPDNTSSPGYAPQTAPVGIAITSADNTNGTWQYSLNSGATWQNVAASTTSALLLAANNNGVASSDMIRFVPSTGYFGTAAFTFLAWDETSGLAAITNGDGGTADASITGGSTAFSTTSATATITVAPINQPPTFTASNPPAGTENSGPATVSGWAVFTPGVPGETVVAYTVTAVGTPSLFSAGPAVDASGNLTYTPATNVIGTSTFTVTVQESGGTANGGQDTSAPQTFTITVNVVNQPPTFTLAGNPAAVNEDASLQTVSNFATNMKVGPANEIGHQTLVGFTVAQTASTGGLTFATAPTINVATGGADLQTHSRHQRHGHVQCDAHR